jgi:hypothetical protein
MPESIPLRKKPPGPKKTHKDRPLDESDLAWSDREINPTVVSANSRQVSRDSSLHRQHNGNGKSVAFKEPDSPKLSDEFDDWDEHDAAMPSDLRPSTDGHHAPLLGRKSDDEGTDGLSRSAHRFHERDPVTQAKLETRKKYTYAAIFLVLSLISFAVQTETAVYIQHELKWEKPYCMLYMTHGSWVVLWPVQLLLLRLQDRDTPWAVFWRRHTQLLRQTALMVRHQTLHPTPRQAQVSPVRYMLKMTAFITCALTLAGGSWYVAVNQTTASDLTAIYNCSAFFAYAFSIPILHECAPARSSPSPSPSPASSSSPTVTHPPQNTAPSPAAAQAARKHRRPMKPRTAPLATWSSAWAACCTDCTRCCTSALRVRPRAPRPTKG